MGQRILLADDSHTIRKVVELTFADSDFQVVAVQNGEMALQKIRESRPDIILLDVIMPGRDGYEVCELVKADPGLSSIPVLLMAGSFEPFDKERALRVGSDGFMSKPFDSRSLITRVTELLDSARKKTMEKQADEGTIAFTLPSAPVPTVPEQPAQSKSPDQTIMFPGFKEIQASEGIGFQEFSVDRAKTADHITPPVMPPEASFADLEDDLREWERSQGTQPMSVTTPPPPPEPTSAPSAIPPPLWPVEAAPIEVLEEPVAKEEPFAPAPEEPPLWRMETPVVLDEPIAAAEEGQIDVSAPENAIWRVQPEAGIEAAPTAPPLSDDLLRTHESLISEIPLEPVPEIPTEPEEQIEIDSADILASAEPVLENEIPISAYQVPPAERPVVAEEPPQGAASGGFVEEYEQTFTLDEEASREPVAPEPEVPLAEAAIEAPETPVPQEYEQTFSLEEEPRAAAAQAPNVLEDQLPLEPIETAPSEEGVEVERIDLPTPSEQGELYAAGLLGEEPAHAEEALDKPEEAPPWVFEESVGTTEEVPVEQAASAPEVMAAAPAPPEIHVLESEREGEPAAAPQPIGDIIDDTPTLPPSRPSNTETIPDLLKSEPHFLKLDMLPQEMVEAVAKRVVEMLSEKAIQEIAWEVVPDLAESLIKKEIERLEKGV